MRSRAASTAPGGHARESRWRNSAPWSLRSPWIRARWTGSASTRRCGICPREARARTRFRGAGGFFGLDRYTIIVIGPRIRRLTLLVVPPDADAPAAERALAAAAAPDASGSAVLILTTSGILGPAAGPA
nr:DUF5994 family protein [Amycolatopsis jiangsuensis]